MNTKKPIQQPPWAKPVAHSENAPVLKIYNSLTRAKEEFVPIVPNRISWYCCGPTVYNHAHMGHARNYVCSDISRRILRDHFGYNVTFVQNVTDIDDKIIVAARQQHLFEEKIVKKYTEVTDELLGLSKGYLQDYVLKKLPDFNGDLKTDLASYIDSLDLSTLAMENPKFPMYTRAAKTAHTAIFRNVAVFDNFVAAIEDVAVPTLDKQYGLSVNDPEIFKKLPAFWENKFNQDMEKLNVLPLSVTTRVSEYVPEIITFVGKIIANGFAYVTKDGSVYFDTTAFESDPNHDYAKLQPWNKGAMELINDGEGSLSVSETGTKKNAADFALWKASKNGEPAWESKWGPGRPGWHIECSVMASDILGETMDIHSGGIDLCFPHHDNELAQSEACFNNKQWVNYFMHNGHLHIQGQKMSKSLKNFITVEEALQTYSARQLRLVFAFGSWEKPLDFKDSLIMEVKAYEAMVSRFFTTIRALNADLRHVVLECGYRSKKLADVHKQLLADLASAQVQVHAAFCDNLSSPAVLRVLGDMVSKSNTFIQSTVTGKNELRMEPLLEITFWIVKTLEILGFEARQDRLGWVDSSENADVSGICKSGSSVEDVAMPYVKSLSQFRDLVRELAINKADSSEILRASDTLRSDLINLGISLDDRPSSGALVKFLNAQEKEELIKQQQEREQQALEKQHKKKQQAGANAKKEQERLEKMKIRPQDLFQDRTAYAEWDESGVPTKTASGEEVTKSMRKKLVKQYQQQEKLHAEYTAKL